MASKANCRSLVHSVLWIWFHSLCLYSEADQGVDQQRQAYSGPGPIIDLFARKPNISEDNARLSAYDAPNPVTWPPLPKPDDNLYGGVPPAFGARVPGLTVFSQPGYQQQQQQQQPSDGLQLKPHYPAGTSGVSSYNQPLPPATAAPYGPAAYAPAPYVFPPSNQQTYPAPTYEQNLLPPSTVPPQSYSAPSYQNSLLPSTNPPLITFTRAKPGTDAYPISQSTRPPQPPGTSRPAETQTAQTVGFSAAPETPPTTTVPSAEATTPVIRVTTKGESPEQGIRVLTTPFGLAWRRKGFFINQFGTTPAAPTSGPTGPALSFTPEPTIGFNAQTTPNKPLVVFTPERTRSPSSPPPTIGSTADRTESPPPTVLSTAAVTPSTSELSATESTRGLPGAGDTPGTSPQTFVEDTLGTSRSASPTESQSSTVATSPDSVSPPRTTTVVTAAPPAFAAFTLGADLSSTPRVSTVAQPSESSTATSDRPSTNASSFEGTQVAPDITIRPNPFRHIKKPETPAPNRIRGKPHILCMANGIMFIAESYFNFDGTIVARGREDRANCSYDSNKNKAEIHDRTINVSFPYSECGEPIIAKKGDHMFQTDVIVTFRDGRIQTFLARCVSQKLPYETEDLPRKIEEALEELNLTPTKVENQAPMPMCTMRVVQETEEHHHKYGPSNESVINEASIGQQLRMEFALNPPSAAFGFLIRNCTVWDSTIDERYVIIDDKGCSVDINIFAHPHYDTYHDLAIVHWHAFKVPDSVALSFRCDCVVCTDVVDDETGQTSCEQIPTPPICPDVVTSSTLQNALIFDSSQNAVKKKKRRDVAEQNLRAGFCLSTADGAPTNCMIELDNDQESDDSSMCLSKWIVAISLGFNTSLLITALSIFCVCVHRARADYSFGRKRPPRVTTESRRYDEEARIRSIEDSNSIKP